MEDTYDTGTSLFPQVDMESPHMQDNPEYKHVSGLIAVKSNNHLYPDEYGTLANVSGPEMPLDQQCLIEEAPLCEGSLGTMIKSHQVEKPVQRVGEDHPRDLGGNTDAMYSPLTYLHQPGYGLNQIDRGVRFKEESINSINDQSDNMMISNDTLHQEKPVHMSSNNTFQEKLSFQHSSNAIFPQGPGNQNFQFKLASNNYIPFGEHLNSAKFMHAVVWIAQTVCSLAPVNSGMRTKKEDDDATLESLLYKMKELQVEVRHNFDHRIMSDAELDVKLEELRALSVKIFDGVVGVAVEEGRVFDIGEIENAKMSVDGVIDDVKQNVIDQ